MDEEIGTTSRLIADPDDLLPYVMGFGKGEIRRESAQMPRVAEYTNAKCT